MDEDDDECKHEFLLISACTWELDLKLSSIYDVSALYSPFLQICKNENVEVGNSGIILENADGPKRCNFCNESFNSRHDLVDHMKVHAAKISNSNDFLSVSRPFIIGQRFRCVFCHNDFATSNALDHHMRSHTERSIKCTICSEEFDSDQELSFHLRTQTCKKRIHSEQIKPYITIDKNMHGDGNEELPVNEGYPSTERIASSKMFHNSDKTFRCIFCHNDFDTDSSLCKHMKKHTGSKLYKCDYCEKRFRDNSQLVAHMKSHRSSSYYECKECGKQFLSHGNLSAHMKTHSHSKTVEGMLYNDGYGVNKELADDTRLYKEKNSYSCEQCEMQFQHNSDLITHLQTHYDEQTYRCIFCHNDFATSTSLSLHMKTHTLEKSLQCMHCEELFNTNSELILHVRTHCNSERTVKCEVCSTLFPSSSQLFNHMRTHTVEQSNHSTEN